MLPSPVGTAHFSNIGSSRVVLRRVVFLQCTLHYKLRRERRVVLLKCLVRARDARPEVGMPIARKKPRGLGSQFVGATLKVVKDVHVNVDWIGSRKIKYG